MTTIDDVLANAEAITGARRRPWRLMMGDVAASEVPDTLDVGTPVMVRTRYLGSWTRGFQIAELVGEGYRLRRTSDGSLLTDEVAFENVRREVDGI